MSQTDDPNIVGALHMRSAAIGGANIVFKGALVDCHTWRLNLQSSTQSADKLNLRSSQACLTIYSTLNDDTSQQKSVNFSASMQLFAIQCQKWSVKNRAARCQRSDPYALMCTHLQQMTSLFWSGFSSDSALIQLSSR